MNRCFNSKNLATISIIAKLRLCLYVIETFNTYCVDISEFLFWASLYTQKRLNTTNVCCFGGLDRFKMVVAFLFNQYQKHLKRCIFYIVFVPLESLESYKLIKLCHERPREAGGWGITGFTFCLKQLKLFSLIERNRYLFGFEFSWWRFQSTHLVYSHRFPKQNRVHQKIDIAGNWS